MTADDIAADLGGTTGGVPNWWDYVIGRGDQVAQQLINDPNRGQWNNESGPDQLPAAVGDINGKKGTYNHLDHWVLAAEPLSWRYWDSLGNHVDPPTILMTLTEFMIAPPTGRLIRRRFCQGKPLSLHCVAATAQVPWCSHDFGSQ